MAQRQKPFLEVPLYAKKGACRNLGWHRYREWSYLVREIFQRRGILHFQMCRRVRSLRLHHFVTTTRPQREAETEAERREKGEANGTQESGLGFAKAWR